MIIKVDKVGNQEILWFHLQMAVPLGFELRGSFGSLSRYNCQVWFGLHLDSCIDRQCYAPEYVVVGAVGVAVSYVAVFAQLVFFDVKFGAYVASVGFFPGE